MAIKCKIVLSFLIVITLFSFNTINCIDMNEVKICVKKMESKDKTVDDYMITYEDRSKQKFFKSIVKTNLLYFQFYAKNDIRIVNATDTIYPIGYIFEDDVNGMLPIVKQIVTFPKSTNYKQLIVNMLNNESIFKLK